MKVLVAHLQEPAPPLRDLRPDVPEDLAAVIHRCLEKRPADRFADAAGVDRALAACRCAGEWTEMDAASWWDRTGDPAEKTS